MSYTANKVSKVEKLFLDKATGLTFNHSLSLAYWLLVTKREDRGIDWDSFAIDDLKKALIKQKEAFIAGAFSNLIRKDLERLRCTRTYTDDEIIEIISDSYITSIEAVEEVCLDIYGEDTFISTKQILEAIEVLLSYQVAAKVLRARDSNDSVIRTIRITTAQSVVSNEFKIETQYSNSRITSIKETETEMNTWLPINHFEQKIVIETSKAYAIAYCIELSEIDKKRKAKK